MEILNIDTKPIDGQKPGTSGLRKKTRTFMEPHYLENFVQSIWDGIGGVSGKTLVLGGDGRYFSGSAAQVLAGRQSLLPGLKWLKAVECVYGLKIAMNIKKYGKSVISV